MIIGSTAGEHWCNRLNTPDLWSLGTPYDEGLLLKLGEFGSVGYIITKYKIRDNIAYTSKFIRAARENQKAYATSMKNISQKS